MADIKQEPIEEQVKPSTSQEQVMLGTNGGEVNKRQLQTLIQTENLMTNFSPSIATV